MRLIHHMILTGLMLGLFALIGTGMVSFTFEQTRERIAYNEHQALLRSLNALVPEDQHDNDISLDLITVIDKDKLGSHKPLTIYRARKNGQPVAAVLTAIAPDGYSGDIKVLVAIQHDGTVLGVRVLSHRETPGLGDDIDIEKSNWITAFNGRTLNNPDSLGWHVAKDGGVFDQFTGATITPRAVVKVVHNSLHYFHEHQEALFTVNSASTSGTHRVDTKKVQNSGAHTNEQH